MGHPTFPERIPRALLSGALAVAAILFFVLGPLRLRSQSTIEVQSGFAEPISVTVDGQSRVVPALGSIEIPLASAGLHHLAWRSDGGSGAETHLLTPAWASRWLWNVGGRKVYRLTVQVFDPSRNESAVSISYITPELLDLGTFDRVFEPPVPEQEIRTDADPLTVRTLEEAADGHSRAALERAREGKAAEAVDVLRRGLDGNPTDLSLLLAVGEHSHAAGQAGEARSAYETVLGTDPWNVPAHRGLQDLLRSVSEGPELAARYEALARENPKNPAAQYLAGRLLAAIPKRSSGYYRKALELQPAYFWAHYGLGYDRLTELDFPGAVESYRLAVSYAPADRRLHALADLMQALVSAGNPVLAFDLGLREPDLLLHDRLLEKLVLAGLLGRHATLDEDLRRLYLAYPRNLDLLDLQVRAQAIRKGDCGPGMGPLETRDPLRAARARFLAALATSPPGVDDVKARFEPLSAALGGYPHDIEPRIHAALAFLRARDANSARALVERADDTRFILPAWARLSVELILGQRAFSSWERLAARVEPEHQADVVAALVAASPPGSSPEGLFQAEMESVRLYRSVSYALASYLARHPSD